MEKQKLIYVESKALFSPSEVSDKAIVFIKDTKEIWTHGVYFSCSGAWATPITLSLTGDTTGSVSIDGSGNASIATKTTYLSGTTGITDANNAASTQRNKIAYYTEINQNASNLFPYTDNANAILSLNVHDYSYTHLLGFSNDGNIYHRRRSAGTWEITWKTILNSSNYSSYALPLSGGTMTGALNFANNTWNKVGDDAYMGDCNVAGMIGIKGSNATPGFAMYNNSGTLLGKLYASGTSLYWSNAKILTSTDSVSEAYLAWGGKNLAGNSSPIDTALAPILGANRLAFLSPNAIDIEYSKDSGTTWTDYNIPDSEKVSLFAGGNNYTLLFLGGDGTQDASIDRTSWRLRITISAIGYSLYCIFLKFMIFVTDYGNALRCALLGRTYSNVQNNVDTWVTFLDTSLRGWSGWNTINHPAGIRIPHTDHYGQIRFEFYITRLGTTGKASWIQKIMGFAPACWSYPSNMAGYGDIYSYDWQLNVTFPAKVTATGGFSGNLTGNLTGNVTGNVTGNADTASFLKCPDKRYLYPALIVTSGGNIGAAFMSASKLGISGDSYYYDAIIIRGHTDSTGGKENAIMFGKSTSSVYHSQYAFGSTTTWGTMYKFLDSNNYSSYAIKVDGTNGTSNGVSALLNKLTTGTDTPVDADYYICQYAGGGATKTSYHRRPMRAMYAYIKSKAISDFLPLSGGTLGSTSVTETDLSIKSSTARLRLLANSDSTNYIQSGNSDFSGNATLKITGYYNNTGTSLYFNFANIYCRAGNYTNIDSGNYSSYALPLSGGTLTGTLISRDIRPSANLSYSLGTSSYYYNYVYANYFKKNGSSNDYVLLGGGEHKLISDFVLNYTAVVPGGSVGNNDSWTLILNNNYSTGWYGPCTMFYIRSKNFGCGILCFYHYWNTELTSGYYDNSVWFFGAEHSAYSDTMGGTGRDINSFLKVYIDKDNDNLKIYYNRYNNLSMLILELLFLLYLEGTLYPKGLIRASHFITNGAVTDLPITSSTFVNIPILTAKNHTEDIKTTRSVYASAFYENSDIRLKENVHSIDLVDLLKNVDLVQFNFKNNLNKKYGVIAQQLEQAGLNNLVYEHNGNKAVDYISLLVLEIQRLRNEIGELKLEINKKG